MPNKCLLVIGAGSQATLALNTARSIGDIEVRGLIDVFDNPSIWGKKIDGSPILGNLSVLDQVLSGVNLYVTVAVGDQGTKRRLVSLMTARGCKFATLVHPNASIAPTVKIGMGCIVSAGVVIEPHTQVGDYVVIRAGCIVSHDVVLEDFVSLSPGATIAGRAHVKFSAVIYTGATLTPGVVIGENAVVGAGAVVLKNVPASSTVFGVPAKVIKRAKV